MQQRVPDRLRWRRWRHPVPGLCTARRGAERARGAAGDVGALVCAAYQGPTPDACADQPVKQPCPGAPKRLALRGESA